MWDRGARNLGGHVQKASGKQTVTYPQLVEVALCYGWIDVQNKTVDAERYAIRFPPRRPQSHWTETNRALAHRLLAEGRMTEAGARSCRRISRLSRDQGSGISFYASLLRFTHHVSRFTVSTPPPSARSPAP